MTLDAIIKQYKQDRKNADAELERLEQQAGELVNKLDNQHDHEQAYETASAELASVAASKETVQNDLDEAVRFDDPRKESLRDEYKELSDKEQALKDAMGDATKAVEENAVDKSDVARLRAQLRRVDAGGSTLVDAVKSAVQDDQSAIRERVDAVDATLPEGDDLELLYSMGHTDLADQYAATIEQNEAIQPGSGEQTREALHRKVQRLLTIA